MDWTDPTFWIAKVVKYWYILVITILVSNLTYGRENRKKYKKWDRVRARKRYENSLKLDLVGKRRKQRRGLWKIFD